MGASYHGAEVALKLPRKSCSPASLESLASVVEELRIFRRLRHPNIVDFYGACIDPEGQDGAGHTRVPRSPCARTVRREAARSVGGRGVGWPDGGAGRRAVGRGRSDGRAVWRPGGRLFWAILPDTGRARPKLGGFRGDFGRLPSALPQIWAE